MSEIVMIEGKHLHEHPDNPRKKLGDLQELTQSIKRNGILQNLTVVPMEEPGEYRVIIGHRRLAAGRIAQVKEYPCVISDMDERQQFATMLEENMQRNDLTIPEQAYGFQMMFDWGDKPKDIAEKTGFSEQTIKHRLEIAKLDEKILKAAVDNEDWQLTVKDLIQLEKIKDIKTRENVLKESNSRGMLFARITNAVGKEKEAANLEKIKPLLEEAGIKEAPSNVYTWSSGYTDVFRKDFTEKISVKEIEERLKQLKKSRTHFYKFNYGTFYILEKEQKTAANKEKSPEEIAREERDKRSAELKTICKDMKNEVEQFIFSTHERIYTGDFHNAERIFKFLVASKEYMTMADALTFYSEGKERKYYSLSEEEFQKAFDLYNSEPLEIRLLILVDRCILQELGSTVLYDGKYDTYHAGKWEALYDLLNECYGFEWSDPEYMLVMDGTHELYEKKEEERS